MQTINMKSSTTPFYLNRVYTETQAHPAEALAQP